jgi:Raf kinase inhibitor-like YbhB/YbcL family protein
MLSQPLISEQRALKVVSNSFNHGETIPRRFTCDGVNISPHIAWTGTPRNTESIVLSVDDPDAPRGSWNHWYVYNIPVGAAQIAEGASGGGCLPAKCEEVKNDFQQLKYSGPCPPSGQHRYIFTLRALDTFLPAGLCSRAEVERRIQSHLIASAELFGLYGPRQRTH